MEAEERRKEEREADRKAAEARGQRANELHAAQLETLKAQMAATVEALKPKAKETKPPKDYVEHFDGHLDSLRRTRPSSTPRGSWAAPPATPTSRGYLT